VAAVEAIDTSASGTLPPSDRFTFRITLRYVHWLCLAVACSHENDVPVALGELRTCVDALLSRWSKASESPKLFIAYKHFKSSIRCCLLWMGPSPPWKLDVGPLPCPSVEVELNGSAALSQFPGGAEEPLSRHSRAKSSQTRSHVMPRMVRGFALAAVRDRIALLLATFHQKSGRKSDGRPLAVWAAWDADNYLSVLATACVAYVRAWPHVTIVASLLGVSITDALCPLVACC
jgi:hypothetical protein